MPEFDPQRFELTFVGRSPAAFPRARVLPPVPSAKVAEQLRAHDIFVTASLHESCSNSLIEALSCGLPALYIDSGSNGELVKEGGRAFTTVTTRVGQAMDLVRHAESGWIVDVENADGLARWAGQVLREGAPAAVLDAARATTNAHCDDAQLPLWDRLLDGFVEPDAS